jgi:hypothetical protein
MKKVDLDGRCRVKKREPELRGKGFWNYDFPINREMKTSGERESARLE